MKILQYPDPMLSTVSAPITQITHGTRVLAEEMKKYVEDISALGLSAVQMGQPVRLICFRFNNEVIVLLNPVIIKRSEQTWKSYEGCLSIGMGGSFYDVTRHKLIKVTATTINGKTVTYKLRDLEGAALQHECDHLEGILINSKGK
jgi:peptide deformylase